jgi:hypothetical protein
MSIQIITLEISIKRPTPQLQNPLKALNVSKEVIQYKRKDGVALSGTIFCLQVMIKQKEKLPLLIWAPSRIKDKNSAGQNNQNLMNLLSLWIICLLGTGYVVLDDASLKRG